MEEKKEHVGRGVGFQRDSQRGVSLQLREKEYGGRKTHPEKTASLTGMTLISTIIVQELVREAVLMSIQSAEKEEY